MLIRKLQLGCNPNSSSIGTLIFAVPPALFVLLLVYGVIGFAVLCRWCSRGESKDSPIEED